MVPCSQIWYHVGHTRPPQPLAKIRVEQPFVMAFTSKVEQPGTYVCKVHRRGLPSVLYPVLIIYINTGRAEYSYERAPPTVKESERQEHRRAEKAERARIRSNDPIIEWSIYPTGQLSIGSIFHRSSDPIIRRFNHSTVESPNWSNRPIVRIETRHANLSSSASKRDKIIIIHAWYMRNMRRLKTTR